MLGRSRLNMSGKLILTNALVLVAVFIAAFLLLWMMTTDLSTEKERQSMHSYLVNTLSSIDERLGELSRATTVAVADGRTQEILVNSSQYNYREALDASEYMANLLLSMVTSRNDISSMLVFSNTALVAKYSLFTISLKSTFSITSDAWFLENLASASVLPYGTRLMTGGLDSMLHTPTLQNPFDNEYLTVLREVNSFSPYRRIGFMMVTTRMSALHAILTKSIDMDAQYLLVDSQGTILCESLGEHFYTPLSEAYPALANEVPNLLSRVRFSGKACTMLAEQSSVSGLTLYVVRPEAMIYQEATRTMVTIVAIFTVALLLVILINSLLIRRRTLPITDLAAAMESFSRTNTRVSVRSTDRTDEAKRLGDAFNAMMDTINDLIFSEYEKTIQLKETQLRQKETELLYLRSQINPHFLYNTLDMIRIRAAINGDAEVAKIIMDLVTFFRFGVGNSSPLVPIRHEIKLMQVYLQLLRCRHPMLKDAYTLDESLLDVSIPSFILQPLVENSLIHGLKAISYDGQLILRVEEDPNAPEGDVLIILSDNGVGMSDEQMKRLNTFDFSLEETDEARQHIGVRNAQSRLNILYGSRYGLHYAHGAQGGVTVTIRIAKEIKKEMPRDKAAST